MGMCHMILVEPMVNAPKNIAVIINMTALYSVSKSP